MTSQPSDGSPLQSAKPALHCPTPHAPFMHTAEALGTTQRRPHAPQFAESLPSGVSQPFAAIPSQSPKPSLQRPIPQLPPEQAGVPFAGVAQRLPHIPQCEVLVRVLVSQPFEGSPSQSD